MKEYIEGSIGGVNFRVIYDFRNDELPIVIFEEQQTWHASVEQVENLKQDAQISRRIPWAEYKREQDAIHEMFLMDLETSLDEAMRKALAFIGPPRPSLSPDELLAKLNAETRPNAKRTMKIPLAKSPPPRARNGLPPKPTWAKAKAGHLSLGARAVKNIRRPK